MSRNRILPHPQDLLFMTLPITALPSPTGVGSHFFLQGILLTQGSNPGLLHCRCILYHLSHQGKPGILEWVANPFSRRTFQPRN